LGELVTIWVLLTLDKGQRTAQTASARLRQLPLLT
jgi:hypothetical protein